MRASRIVESLALLAAVATAANVVEMGLQRIPSQPSQPNSKAKRAASTYVETLVNNVTGGGYYASVTVGTPPQPQLLVIDTGSSDVWVVAYNADLCTNPKLQAEDGDSCGETYNPSKSSTYKLVSKDGFQITYVDGTGSSGDYFTDTFAIGGASIKSLQMGYATETIRGTGIIGVSFASSESATSTYPSIMEQFMSQGLISSMAFSLYLNDYRSSSGSILFGGVDTDKFIGALSTLPILQTVGTFNSSYTTFAVALDGISASSGSGNSAASISFPGGQPIPAILDSGTTLSFLPGSIADSLFNAVGAYTDDVETGYTFIDCGASANLAITFNFGKGASITIPASQVVLDLFEGEQDQIPSNVPFQDACLFGFQNIDAASSGSSGSKFAKRSSAATTTEYALLGDTFLRSAYAVYDLSNNQIALAPANLNSTSSNIVELQASSGIPSLTGVKSQQTTAPTATGSGDGSGSGGAGTVTVTAAPKATSSNAAGPSPARGPDFGVFAVASIACLFSFVGAALVIA